MPQLLSQVEVDTTLPHLHGWTQRAKALIKEFECRDTNEAQAFINAVREKAQEYDHHPDLLLHDHNVVRLRLCSRQAGGLTDSDIRLARAIEEFAPGS